MRGKVRVVFLAVLMVAMAGAAQADTIIPMVPGYTTTYEVNWAGSPSGTPYNASMQITGGPENPYSDGNQWWTLQFNNMDGGGGSDTSTSWVRATETAVYLNGSAAPHFQTGAASWTDEEGRNVTSSKKIDNFTTPGGLNFTDVYQIDIDDHNGYQTLTEYWKPGVGFLGEVVPRSYGDSHLSRTTYITAYSTSAVPVPPSLLLLGSGLVGLLGLRGFRRS